MSTKARIDGDLKAAMRGGDTRRRDTLRLLLAALKQREVDERKALEEADIVSVIDRMIKQRRDSIAQFEKGGRADLADAEKFELTVLETYMPQAMSDSEIAAAIDSAMAETGATTPSEMGRVMGILKPKLAGRADMGRVSTMVKARLAGSR